MEGGKALPDIISQYGHHLASIFLEGPASVGQVAVNVVQEGLVKDCIFVFKLGSLVLLLDISEVTVVFDIKGLLHAQPNESFIPLHFMLLVHFHGAMGYNVAIVVNGSDVVVEPIDFFHVDFLYVQ